MVLHNFKQKKYKLKFVSLFNSKLKSNKNVISASFFLIYIKPFVFKINPFQIFKHLKFNFQFIHKKS